MALGATPKFDYFLLLWAPIFFETISELGEGLGEDPFIHILYKTHYDLAFRSKR
jgi:hypothetical protein